jgi:hypothetical protein
VNPAFCQVSAAPRFSGVTPNEVVAGSILEFATWAETIWFTLFSAIALLTLQNQQALRQIFAVGVLSSLFRHVFVRVIFGLLIAVLVFGLASKNLLFLLLLFPIVFFPIFASYIILYSIFAPASRVNRPLTALLALLPPGIFILWEFAVIAYYYRALGLALVVWLLVLSAIVWQIRQQKPNAPA